MVEITRIDAAREKGVKEEDMMDGFDKDTEFIYFTGNKLLSDSNFSNKIVLQGIISCHKNNFLPQEIISSHRNIILYRRFSWGFDNNCFVAQNSNL